uniref:Uncharacterized protein n=1 Tax=Arundo donax TaxID=35708 RepID=A0A0A9CG09_ARUDO
MILKDIYSYNSMEDRFPNVYN